MAGSHADDEPVTLYKLHLLIRSGTLSPAVWQLNIPEDGHQPQD